jgi:zinc and cadmium transporter
MLAYALISVVLVSLASVVAALPLILKKKASQQLLLGLLGVSVGTLLGGVFIHFLPESIAEGYTLGLAINILLGFLAFFIIEKIIHYRHKHGLGHGHSHAYHLAPVNLIGDAFHNLIDGLVIGGAYLINTGLGIAATISVIFHELPQEVADFGILLYSGYSKKKAVLFNLLSAATAIVGALLAYWLASFISGFNTFILPFAAGAFLYIAASNLIPELNRSDKISDMIIQTITILLGVGIMVLIFFFVPHAH